MNLRKKQLIQFLVIVFSYPAFAQFTIVDEIMRDYKQSETFAHFLRFQQPKMVPGDDVFLYKKLKNSPDMLKTKKFPALTYLNGAFNLKYLKSSIQFRFSDRNKFEFEINNQKVVLHPSMVPSLRWARINELLAPKSSSIISFMPVAFAQQNGEATFSNVITFSVISRLALEAASGLEIKSENPSISFLLVMKKMRTLKTPCDYAFLTEMLKKMSAIQATSIRCESSQKSKKGDPILNGNIRFELPFGDNAFRNITLNRTKQIIEEESPDFPGKKLIYKKIYSDLNVDFLPISSDRKKVQTIRQKGLVWTPVGSLGTNSTEIQERAEQLRELINFTLSSDFCARCGLTMQRVLKELAKELEMNPDLDQFGNDPNQLNQEAVAPSTPPMEVAPEGAGTDPMMALPPMDSAPVDMPQETLPPSPPPPASVAPEQKK